MDTTIDQQVAMDEALVPHAKRLRIGRSNFRLSSDIKSKESTLQLVYDVLRLTPFFKAFLVIADVLEIYMQEFWTTTTVHHHAIRFKMDNKKHIVNLESFRDMIHICPRAKHKDSKKSNEMYYPRFTKVIIHHFMSKDPSIPRRNKVNWHYVRDDHMFSTIKLVSRHQNTQQFGALLPIELTNDDIRNSNAYKEYYAVSIGVAPPKPKASVRKTKSSSDITITPPTAAAGQRLTTSNKGKQIATSSKAKSLSALSEVAMTEVQQLKLVTKRSLQQTHISQANGSGTDKGTDEGDDEGKDGDGDDGKEGDGDDDDDQEVERDDEKDDEEEGGDDEQEYDEETRDEESFDPIPKTPENNDEEGNGEEDLGLNVGRQSSFVSSQFVTSMLNPTLNVAPSTLIQDLPNFGSLFGFDNRLKTLEANFFEFMQMNQFVGAVSAIPGIIQRYMDQRMNETVKVAVQIQSDRLRDEAKKNNEFLKTIDENIQKIIKEQTSYAVAADLSEMELKKILIEKMEGNKPGSKRHREGMEPESASAPKEKATKSVGKSTQGTKSQQASASESAIVEEPMQTTFQMEEPSHPEFDTGAEDQPIVQSSQHPKWFSQQPKPPTPDRDWNKTLSDTHGSIQPWIMDTLELIAGPTYELLKGSCKSPVELEYHLKEVYKATTDQLDRVNPEGQQYPHNLLKPLPLIPNNRGRRVIPFGHFINNDLEYLRGESARDVYSKRRIIAVTELKIVEWHNYKHLNWITMRRDDDKLYKFKEYDFKRLSIQDIEDMLLLLVQGKLTNLTVEERFTFNVSLQMFTRSIVIQRRVEDLQLGVESYQKKLNLTKPDTYLSDLKHKEAYTAYSNPRGFIYQNKNKKNRLMQIDELHKFSDGTLTDVRTALDDRLKGIRMKYLPQSIWRKSDKDRASSMI
nr:hypothetical protein [Tanacetum cinerariifolium]